MARFDNIGWFGLALVTASLAAPGCSSSSSTHEVAAAGSSSAGSSSVGGFSSLGGSSSLGGAKATGGASSPSSTAAVDTSKRLEDLTPAEMKQLCLDAVDYMSSQITNEQMLSMSCSVAGLLGSLSGTNPTQACHTAYTACVTAAAGGNPTSSNNCDTVTVPTDCTATVSAYNTCMQDQVAATKAVLGEFGPQLCDQLSTNPGGPQSPATPASCQAVQQLCPSLDLSSN